jgi:hypothetical protein
MQKYIGNVYIRMLQPTLVKYLLVICFLTNLTCVLQAQSNDPWVAFYNKDTTLVGYKDMNGIVKMEPKFMGITTAKKFDKIIAVMEEADQAYRSYYVTKTGKIVGKDSVYIFDNTADCESEGFIRFRDKKTEHVGMLNSNGKVVIPAVYNGLTRVTNGMVVALKDAQKKYSNKDKHSDCNHFSWIGGRQLLIDTVNSLLVDNFNQTDQLYMFSYTASSKLSKDPIRETFKGTNGTYYAFINLDKEFKSWLKLSLLDNLSKDNLIKATYKTITYWNDSEGWISEPNTDFVNRNFEMIKTKLLQLKFTSCDYDISDGDLNPVFQITDDFQDFYNNCDESKNWLHPIRQIIINYKRKNDFVQDHFEFLRTSNGYRLINMTISVGEIK